MSKGRQKGFKLSDEQKAKMQEGRKNKKLYIVKEKPITTNKPRGRLKGSKLSQETKDKMRLAKIHNRNKEKVVKVYEKPILNISKKWKNGFDFWPEMRMVLRTLHRNLDCKKIEKEIVNPNIWENREKIIEILKNYFIIEVKK